MPIKWTARGKRIAKGVAIGAASFAGGYGAARRRGKKREHGLVREAGRVGYELGQGRTIRMRNPKTGKVTVITARQAQRAWGQKKPKTTAVGRKRQKR